MDLNRHLTFALTILTVVATRGSSAGTVSLETASTDFVKITTLTTFECNKTVGSMYVGRVVVEYLGKKTHEDEGRRTHAYKVTVHCYRPAVIQLYNEETDAIIHSSLGPSRAMAATKVKTFHNGMTVNKPSCLREVWTLTQMNSYDVYDNANDRKNWNCKTLDKVAISSWYIKPLQRKQHGGAS